MIWAALAFFLVAVFGSLVYLALRAWRLWRTIRTVSQRATEAVGQVLDSATAAEAHAAGLSTNVERLSGAAARLQQGLAELAAIRAAAGEPRALLATIRGFVPSK